MKSGSLNFLEPSGPLQACNGTALPFFTWEDDIKVRSRETTWTDGLNSVLKIAVFWNETLSYLVDGYVSEKHTSLTFGQNIRYEDESDYSDTLVNILPIHKTSHLRQTVGISNLLH